MDQIANLVIDLGIDAAEFKNEIPRIKNLLNGAASDAERSSARMQRFMERQTQAARQTTQAASSAATAASVHAQTVEKNAQAHERMAREVEKTRQRMEALSQKMREEQAQAMALAEAQDKAAAAFYRQIDSVKQASAGLQELQRIQQQIRQARNSGGIGQQDYLALISEVTAKTRVLTQAEEEAMRGWTIKGKPASGRAVLSQEQDGIKSHTHSASASSTDLGTKTTSSFDYGTKSTNNTGAHTHSLSGSTSSAGAHSHVDGRRFNTSTFKDTYQYGSTAVGSNSYQVQGAVGLGIGTMANTNSAGAHTHSLSGTAASAGAHAHTVGIGAHTHSVAIGSHGHTITVNAAGNAENTVKNIAFNYIVRLA